MSLFEKKIYLDSAASTQTDPRVIRTMARLSRTRYANPSSAHEQGQRAAQAFADAKKTIANALGCNAEEIIATSGGTESDNMALMGIARAYRHTGNHILISEIEHPAIIESARVLEHDGFDVEKIAVSREGFIDPEAVLAKIRPDTILVSIQYVNNEIGAIQPIAEIGKKIARYKRAHALAPTQPPFVHTDACQAGLTESLAISDLHADALTLNGAKLYGPKGIGILYVRKGIQVTPLLVGGGQERGMRAGTENLPALAGLATALEIAAENREKNIEKFQKLQAYFTDAMARAFPDVELNGPRKSRVPHIMNFFFPNVDAETLVLYLSEHGIACSTGAACLTNKETPSHVIQALGHPLSRATSSVRFSLSTDTTIADVKKTVATLQKVMPLIKQDI